MTVPRPDLHIERALWQGGYRWVVGADEAGRGALAGPVAAAVVVLPPDISPLALEGVRDSKMMTPRQRALWAVRIKTMAVGWAVGYASADEIDAQGIVAAVHLALRRALDALGLTPDFLLLDYLRLLPCEWPQATLVRGDRQVLSIAAASVLAKVHRDAWMTMLGERFPEYGFAMHKGYGTRRHREAIARYGLSPYHRRTFWHPKKGA